MGAAVSLRPAFRCYHDGKRVGAVSRGLRAGASSEDVKKDCKVLLEVIEKFGSVEVWVDE